MKVLFVDIETTGLDPFEDAILEVFAKVVDLGNPNSNVGPEFHWIITSELNELPCMNGFIFDMHTKNGLIAEIQAKNLTIADKSSLLPNLFNFLDEAMEESSVKDITLAGRSVHFDKAFIENTTGLEFHHRVFDLSSIATFYTLVTGNDAKALFKDEDHRARSDVMNDLALFRYMVRNFDAMYGMALVAGFSHD